MSAKGYYRYKVAPITKGRQSVTFYANGVAFVTHVLDAKLMCSGWVQLKWLDENGQYRFYPFLNLFRTKDTAKSIGSASRFVTSLLESQSDTINVGQSTSRSITLRAMYVTAAERLVLASLGNSPKVYLYKGDFSTDDVSDYIEVKVKTDGIIRTEKQQADKYEVTIELPKHYNITML